MRARMLALTMLCCLGCTQRKDSGIRGSAAAAIQQAQRRVAQDRARVDQNGLLLAELGLFGPSAAQRDAGALLNELVPFSPAGTATAALAIPPKLHEQLLGEGWRGSAEIVSDNLDYRWLSELKAYDHWNLWNAPQFRGTGPFAFSSAPIPNFVVFMDWAKLRLREGQRRGEAEVARSEVLHLARVLASTEVVVGAVVAGKIVDLVEGKDSTGALARQQVKSLEERTSLIAEPKVLEEALSKLDAPLACVAAHESLWEAYVMRPILEAQFSASYEILDRALQKKGSCRWQPLRSAWAERASKGRFVDEFAAVAKNPAAVRALRKHYYELSQDPRAADAAPDEIGLLLLTRGVQGQDPPP